MSIIPDRDPTHYKGNKIWTELAWTSADIPESWVLTKFSTTLDALPYIDQWITHIPDDSPQHYVGACFGTTSLTVHTEVIQVLSKLLKKDRFAFSYIAVIDARHEVIGPDFPPHEPIPFLCGNEITSGKRIHRNRSDGVFDEHYEENQRKNATGAVIVTSTKVGPREYLVYQCRESSANSESNYCRSSSQTITNPWSFPDKMNIVYKDHIKWLLEQRSISRDCFQMLRISYQNDVMLEERTKNRFLKVLKRKFARGERILYNLPEPSKEWCDLSFTDQITANHQEHKELMRHRGSLSHTLHRRQKKLYNEDPFMDESMLKLLIHIINQLFGAYLDAVHEHPQSNEYKYAHRYWVEEIPVTDPDLPPLVPYDLW